MVNHPIYEKEDKIILQSHNKIWLNKTDVKISNLSKQLGITSRTLLQYKSDNKILSTLMNHEKIVYASGCAICLIPFASAILNDEFVKNAVNEGINPKTILDMLDDNLLSKVSVSDIEIFNICLSEYLDSVLNDNFFKNLGR